MKFKRFKNSKGLEDFKDQLWDEGAVGGRKGGRENGEASEALVRSFQVEG